MKTKFILIEQGRQPLMIMQWWTTYLTPLMDVFVGGAPERYNHTQTESTTVAG